MEHRGPLGSGSDNCDDEILERRDHGEQLSNHEALACGELDLQLICAGQDSLRHGRQLFPKR